MLSNSVHKNKIKHIIHYVAFLTVIQEQYKF